MRNFVLVLILALFAGCSDPNPKNIVFGPDPLTQMEEQKEQFKKLSEEELGLLVGYLAVIEIRQAFGAKVKPITGRTVGEVLIDAEAMKQEFQEQ